MRRWLFITVALVPSLCSAQVTESTLMPPIITKKVGAGGAHYQGVAVVAPTNESLSIVHVPYVVNELGSAYAVSVPRYGDVAIHAPTISVTSNGSALTKPSGHVASCLLADGGMVVAYRDAFRQFRGTVLVAPKVKPGMLPQFSAPIPATDVDAADFAVVSLAPGGGPQRIVMAYKYKGPLLHQGLVRAMVVQTDGSLEIGPEVVFNENRAWNISLAALPPTASKLASRHFVIAYRDGSQQGKGTMILGAVSTVAQDASATIELGPKQYFSSSETMGSSLMAIDADHVIVTFLDLANQKQGVAVTAEVDRANLGFYFGRKEIISILPTARVIIAPAGKPRYFVALYEDSQAIWGRLGVTVGLVSDFKDPVKLMDSSAIMMGAAGLSDRIAMLSLSSDASDSSLDLSIMPIAGMFAPGKTTTVLTTAPPTTSKALRGSSDQKGEAEPEKGPPRTTSGAWAPSVPLYYNVIVFITFLLAH